MAMTLGSAGGQGVPAPEMNVTPLIDVVLVLLIIFMAMTPLADRRFWVHTPLQKQEEVEQQELDDPNPPLVLRIGADRGLTVNGLAVSPEELSVRLRRMFAARDDHVLFVDAADDVPVGFVVESLDRARAGGAVTIAALTTQLATESVAPTESLASPAP